MEANKLQSPSLPPHSGAPKEWREVLTPEAIAFVNQLADRFSDERVALLARRAALQRQFDAGAVPEFPDETQELREADWHVGAIPADLQDRRVEITGPPDRKMVINALNSGANVFMADFEDSLCPTWGNLIEGQWNLMQAVRRSLAFATPEGKQYRLNEKTAVLIVRPRGWHLPEKHWFLGDDPIAGAFVDFGLFLHHNAAELLSRNTVPTSTCRSLKIASKRGSGRRSSSTPRNRSALRAAPSR